MRSISEEIERVRNIISKCLSSDIAYKIAEKDIEPYLLLEDYRSAYGLIPEYLVNSLKDYSEEEVIKLTKTFLDELKRQYKYVYDSYKTFVKSNPLIEAKMEMFYTVNSDGDSQFGLRYRNRGVIMLHELLHGNTHSKDFYSKVNKVDSSLLPKTMNEVQFKLKLSLNHPDFMFKQISTFPEVEDFTEDRIYSDKVLEIIDPLIEDYGGCHMYRAKRNYLGDVGVSFYIKPKELNLNIDEYVELKYSRVLNMETLFNE